MESYTKEQVFVVEQYVKNNEGLAATILNFRIRYGWNSELTSSTLNRLIQKYMGTKHQSYESVAENPGTTIWHHGHELAILRSCLPRILKKSIFKLTKFN